MSSFLFVFRVRVISFVAFIHTNARERVFLFQLLKICLCVPFFCAPTRNDFDCEMALVTQFFRAKSLYKVCDKLTLVPTDIYFCVYLINRLDFLFINVSLFFEIIYTFLGRYRVLIKHCDSMSFSFSSKVEEEQLTTCLLSSTFLSGKSPLLSSLPVESFKFIDTQDFPFSARANAQRNRPRRTLKFYGRRKYVQKRPERR